MSVNSLPKTHKAFDCYLYLNTYSNLIVQSAKNYVVFQMKSNLFMNDTKIAQSKNTFHGLGNEFHNLTS